MDLTAGSRVIVRHPEESRPVNATVLAIYDHWRTRKPTANVQTDDGFWMPLVPVSALREGRMLNG